MVKIKLTVSIEPEMVHWIDEQVKKGYFADRSHAVFFSLTKVRQLVAKGEIRF